MQQYQRNLYPAVKQMIGPHLRQEISDIPIDIPLPPEYNSITSSKSVGSYFLVSSSYLFDKTRTMEAPSKKQKVAQYSADVIVEIMDAKGNVVLIRALLDTGTLETIILKPYVAPNCSKGYKGSPWKTLGGIFITHH
jgi:hypothetical protein